MQTFLSESTVQESVEVLDNVRLNKQLLECRQILHAISITPEGGGSRVDGKVPFASNHPVTNMYRGYEWFLGYYAGMCWVECDTRGIKTEKNMDAILALMDNFSDSSTDFPSWFYGWPRERILWTHRASLYNKDPEWYAQYKNDAESLVPATKHVVCCPEKVRKGKHNPYYYPTHDQETQ